jgi:protein-disulfide isomerase
MADQASAAVDFDFDVDVFGAERAAARLTKRLGEAHSSPLRVAGDGRRLLTPPSTPGRDRVDGVDGAPATLVVFGAFATPWSRLLSLVMDRVREDHPATVAIAWRHYPGPATHPRATLFALAAEAAAASGQFWAMTRVLLTLRRDRPEDLRGAMVRAGVDPDHALAVMRADVGSERIVDDVASARASAVVAAPALFVGGARYDGRLEPAAVSAALGRVTPSS